MRKRSVRALSVLWFAACIGLSSQAQGEYIRPIETDCAEASFPLPYLSYGITTPPKQEGWRCTATIAPSLSPPNRMADWKKSGKKIEFSEMVLSDLFSSLLRQGKQQEPEATIRALVELFQRNKNVLEKNEFLKTASEDYVNYINGIVWSKNNELAIAYTFYEGNKEINEEEQANIFKAQTNAYIYKKGQDKEFLVF